MWLPERVGRRGRPGTGRPPFPESFVEHILADETVWRDDRFALTPNKHPFAARQLLPSARARSAPDASPTQRSPRHSSATFMLSRWVLRLSTV